MGEKEKILKNTRLEVGSPNLTNGAETIKRAVKTLSSSPGVYRMIDDSESVLYVGKARNLKRRVAAYTRPSKHPVRIQRMIAATHKLEFIETHTEAEALLLESNLIKRLKPLYNILLRDDKSFPYIRLTTASNWPQLLKHRGTQNEGGEYYGPFASAGSVNRTLAALQRAFPLRDCSDSVFKGRTRTCLQYQIKRCSGPCVGKISERNYKTIVEDAQQFLSGKTRKLQEKLSIRMEEASENLDFEEAATLRDRIHALTQIQARQDINITALGDADVIALENLGGLSCVQVFFFRNGQNFGNRTYFPSRTANQKREDIISAFLGQFYANKTPPPLIMVNLLPSEKNLLEEALTCRANRKVSLYKPSRGPRVTLVKRAAENAREELARRLSQNESQEKILAQIASKFQLHASPNRIEVYDNSHILGENPVGAMIVATSEGFAKSSYRKFNIKNDRISPGDDYAMIREVITRRFKRALREDPSLTSKNWPDLLLIDGGKGHLTAVAQVLADLRLKIPIVAISKGPDRDAGREQFHTETQPSFIMKPDDPALYYLQRLRDEAHRFAIGSHKIRRQTKITKSLLDQIEGIGSSRKKALLNHFGSAKAVGEAGETDLGTVKGISNSLAKKIYDFFHATR